MNVLQSPKHHGGVANNAILGYDPAAVGAFMSPQAAKPGKSFLYTIDTSNNQGNPTEFFLKNNLNQTMSS